MDIKVGNKIAKKGEKIHELFSIGKRPDGTDISVPLMGIMGDAPGPILGIVTGVHGDEYEGPEAVRSLINKIDPSALKGGIICTPQANISAFELFNRKGWVDQLDMNRSYPGRSDGYLTERVANVIVKEIVEQSDFLLDLHSGGESLDLEPYVGFCDSDDSLGIQSFELAKSFGVPLLYSSTPFPNVLRLEAYKRNIPAILVEVGGEGRCHIDTKNKMESGLWNVLSHLGMIEGPLKDLPEEFTVIEAPPSGEFIHSPSGGFLRNHVKVGMEVTEGEILCEIIDMFGNKLDQIQAPFNGIVLMIRSIPSIRLGDWAVAVVKVTNKIKSYDTFKTLRKHISI